MFIQIHFFHSLFLNYVMMSSCYYGYILCAFMSAEFNLFKSLGNSYNFVMFDLNLLINDFVMQSL